MLFLFVFASYLQQQQRKLLTMQYPSSPPQQQQSSPQQQPSQSPQQRCSTPGCGKGVYCKQLCRSHYNAPYLVKFRAKQTYVVLLLTVLDVVVDVIICSKEQLSRSQSKVLYCYCLLLVSSAVVAFCLL